MNPENDSVPRVLFVRPADVFGRRLYYPECDETRLLVELLRTETLTETNLETLKRFGYEVRTRSETL